jgi:hypothetical protein
MVSFKSANKLPSFPKKWLAGFFRMVLTFQCKAQPRADGWKRHAKKRYET